MERVRIDELKALQRANGKVTNADIAEAVFKGDKLRPVDGAKRKKVSTKRGENIIARWNNGHDLTALKPRHLIRLGRFFNVTTLADLMEE